MNQVARPTKEAAQRAGFSAGTFANMRVSGRGPRFIKVGAKVVYRDADVDAWLEERLASSTSEVAA